MPLPDPQIANESGRWLRNRVSRPGINVGRREHPQPVVLSKSAFYRQIRQTMAPHAITLANVGAKLTKKGRRTPKDEVRASKSTVLCEVGPTSNPSLKVLFLFQE
jgi:hypothetical protein